MVEGGLAAEAVLGGDEARRTRVLVPAVTRHAIDSGRMATTDKDVETAKTTTVEERIDELREAQEGGAHARRPGRRRRSSTSAGS